MAFMVDITDETRPFAVSSFHVPEKPGKFCERGGRFGAQDRQFPEVTPRLRWACAHQRSRWLRHSPTENFFLQLIRKPRTLMALLD